MRLWQWLEEYGRSQSREEAGQPPLGAQVGGGCGSDQVQVAEVAGAEADLPRLKAKSTKDVQMFAMTTPGCLLGSPFLAHFSFRSLHF